MFQKITTVLFITTLFVLQSCKPSADKLINNIKSESRIPFEINKDGTSGKAKSFMVKLPYNHDSFNKLEIAKNTIDKTLGMMPSDEKLKEFNGFYLEDKYYWIDSQKEVSWLARFKDKDNVIEVLIFYIEK